MKAIILAAGRGSRMKSLTDENPKCLVKLKGHTLLSLQIDALRQAGATEIAIVTGYRREMLADFADREFHNPRWSETNMVQSLCTAREWLAEAPCIVSYSDIFYAPDIVSDLMELEAALAISFDPRWQTLWANRFGDPLLDAETFRRDGDGLLQDIGRKPETVSEVQGQYMGLLRFAPEGWRAFEAMLADLPPDRTDTIDMTSALRAVIERGEVPIHTVPCLSSWGEVDNAEDLMLYEQSPDRDGHG